MLFTEIERTDTGPSRRAESGYAYLNRSARPEAARVRQSFDEWFGFYPENERVALASAFQSPIDSQFVAAAFELYLHELLRRLGYKIEVHPENPTGESGRPDFLATCPAGKQLYVEAVLATEVSDAERSAAARMNVVYDALNNMESADFFLGMELRGSPQTPPPAKKLRARLARWLGELDADAVAQAQSVGGNSTLPALLFEHDGWQITFRAIPKSPSSRGKPGVRPVGFEFSGVKMVSTWTAIRDAIIAKGSNYGELPAPLLVAVNVGSFHVDKIDVMEALFGKEGFLVSPHQTDAEPEMVRAPNGAWTSAAGPRYRRVSAALIAPDVQPWSVAVRDVRLYHNPWARYQCSGPICSLPQCIPVGGKMESHPGIHPREVLGLPARWPE